MIKIECKITFKAGAHELVLADAAVQRVDVSAFSARDEIERALVGVGDRVTTAYWVVVGGTDATTTDAATVHTLLTATNAVHPATRVCCTGTTTRRRYTLTLKL